MIHLERIKKLTKALSCDALIIDDLTDLYYLTGITLSLGTLLVKPDETLLLVDARYYEHCQSKSPVPVKLSTENPLETLISKKSTIGFNQETTTYQAYTKLEKQFSQLKPLNNPIKPLRNIKDSTEISLLKDAANLGVAGYDHLLTLLKEGITEKELAIELEIFWKKGGAEGLAFEPIIAFGANSSMPHYRPGNTALKSGDVVQFDLGVTLNHYNSDMSRVVFFGEPKAKLTEIYQIVHDAQLEALKLCQPGTTIADLDLAARDYITSKGYGDEFSHSLGHGIGLDVHEDPRISHKGSDKNETLKAGMVITIEPGIYLPSVGGVRIEDTVVITETGFENLTPRSKDILIINN